MLFGKKIKPGDYEVSKEGEEDVMYINYENVNLSPSLEGSAVCMSDTVEKILQSLNVSRIIFYQKKNYEYDQEQTKMLKEIAIVYNHLVKQKRILLESSNIMDYGNYSGRQALIQDIVLNLLKSDPIGAYVELKRLVREERINLEKAENKEVMENTKRYLGLLLYVYNLIDNTKLVGLVKPFLAGHVIGERAIYRTVFKPNITPDFMLTRLMAEPPLTAREIDAYNIDDDTNVMLFNLKDDIKILYHLSPPEFKLTEDQYMLLDLARSVLSEHQPKAEEFVNIERMRETFFNIGRDLINELAENKGIDLKYDEVENLARILVRYTVGFGLLEILLKDIKIQDVVINGPIGETPIFIVHQDYGECVTNIIPSRDDGLGWATKFRIISGRPLDEANPVLDTELIIPGARARVAIVGSPLNPHGLGYAFRRHRDKPWTLSLYVKNKMISDLGAGLMSFLIDGSRSLLIAGTRSSGKCVDGDTMIQISDGRLIKIKDLIGKERLKIDDGMIHFPKEEYSVPCLNKFNLENSKIINVLKRNAPNNLIKLRVKSGKEIITTSEHPYFIYHNKLDTIRADNIKKGNLIATPRKIDIKGKEMIIDLSIESYCKEIYEDYYVLKGKTNSLTIRFPKKVNCELAEFLGLIIGDGHVDSAKIEFHNSCHDVIGRYKELLRMFNVNYREFNSHTTHVVQITSKILSKVLYDYFDIPFGNKSDKVRIPNFILMSNNDILASFLRGYFDTGGHISIGIRDIELVTASKEMSKNLTLTLNRFGIVAFTKNKIIKDKIYYRILIRGSFVVNFARHIGFLHPSKKKRLNDIMNRSFIKNTNIDVIPNGAMIVTEIRKRLRISTDIFRLSGKDYWIFESNKYRITRYSFSKVINFFKERYKKIASINKQIDKLRVMSFDYLDYLKKFERLRIILGVSYVTIASDLKLSDRSVRNIFQKNKKTSFEVIKNLSNIYNIFNKKFLDIKKISTTETRLGDLSILIKNNMTTYTEIARLTNIPESTIKSYSYGGINISINNLLRLENALHMIKNDLLYKLKEGKILLDEICLNIPEYVQVGIILTNLKNILNVKNIELISENVSKQTVSNFFNGRGGYDFDVVKDISLKMIKIYDTVVNTKTLNLINEAYDLANSDIFWDEVLSAEIINKKDEFVYDLTIENKHNFVANGLIAHNTSFLGSCLVEIMRKYRILTIEDTLELSTDYLRKLGYNIQPLKVRAALAVTGGTEFAADEGIRTSLRLGDSALIVGEVRSIEAKALYEAMRVGALANVVAGTIHGDSPYGVFDRVVNDLGVPKTSFKATDIIVVANPIKTADGLHSKRRIVSITEVRKEWDDDPLKEGAFVDLMRYNSKTDMLEPTDNLINGDSEIIKNIAANVKEWAGNWDAVWDNILLRAKIKKQIVDVANKSKIDFLLEADFTVKANDEFHKISDEIRQKKGYLDSKQIFFYWNEWLKKEVKKIKTVK